MKARAHVFVVAALVVAAVVVALGSESIAGEAPGSAAAVEAAPPIAAADAVAADAAAASDAAAAEPTVASAVASTDRPAADRARDADRKPAEVLVLMDVQPGMTVVDLMSGGGYYAELLARTVGPEGKVYLHNTPYVIQRFAAERVEKRLADGRLPNVERHDAELTDLGLSDGSLDAAFMVLFYHDTYWMEIDRPAMLAEIRRLLVPGGIFAVVDHAAAADTKDRDVKSLHRVDEQMVEDEILAAGFELVTSSDLLRHPEDDRTTNVFDESIRGKTDRFIYKFRKPD